MFCFVLGYSSMHYCAKNKLPVERMVCLAVFYLTMFVNAAVILRQMTFGGMVKNGKVK